MSYENTRCPCRGQKLPETMLCPDCEAAVAGTYDRREMDNPAAPLEARRSAAIRILAVACRRTRAPSPASVSSVCSVGTV